MELLLRGGADALARNFAGLQPHKLASPGSPAWEQLLAHLQWRSCLDEPRLCHFLPCGWCSLCLTHTPGLKNANVIPSENAFKCLFFHGKPEPTLWLVPRGCLTAPSVCVV